MTTMPASSKTSLLPTGGFSRWRWRSIQFRKSKGLRRGCRFIRALLPDISSSAFQAAGGESLADGDLLLLAQRQHRPAHRAPHLTQQLLPVLLLALRLAAGAGRFERLAHGLQA